jgi:hypothetical protein
MTIERIEDIATQDTQESRGKDRKPELRGYSQND